jgi:hypothetical protein
MSCGVNFWELQRQLLHRMFEKLSEAASSTIRRIDLASTDNGSYNLDGYFLLKVLKIPICVFA